MKGWFSQDAAALVTGGGSGIGRATALAFAEYGVNVIVSDITQAAAVATVEAIVAAGGNAVAHAADVSDEEAVRGLVDKVLDTYGRLDCAFNNAGVNIEFTGEYDVAEFDRTMSVNCRGVFLAMKYEVAAMLKQGVGAIVNTSSINGLVGNPMQPGYVASKHAVVGITRQAALRYGMAGIRVNAVCPGLIDTPMTNRPEIDLDTIRQYIVGATAMRRIGTAQEIADAVVWLSSNKASYVTGHAMVVDGGLTAA